MYRKRVDAYRVAWKQYDRVILNAITSRLELQFYLPVIDASIAPMIPSFSTPLQINFKSEPDEFVDILTHELIHILMSDNRENIEPDDLVKIHWSEYEPKIGIHIMVHAVLKYVYLDVLKQPDRLKRDIHRSQTPAYALAWKIVEESDYSAIIEQMSDFVEQRKK